MKGTFHHDLFYDEIGDMEAFEPSCRTFRLRALPAAVVVPHARFSLIKDLVGEALGAASLLEPEQIAVLAPLHSPASGLDKTIAAITTPQTEAEGRAFRIKFAKLPSPYVAESLAPFQNEPSCELLYPALAKVFPQACLLPLFAARGPAKLKALIGQIILQTPKTLFVLTCNAAGSDLRLGRTVLAGRKDLCNRLWADALGGTWEIASLGKAKDATHFSGWRLD